MIIHKDLNSLHGIRNPVLTIGSFDGVHCGHRIILQRLNKIAAKHDGESVVITFHPHPRLFLFPGDDSLRLLNTLDEKASLLEKEGVDHLVLVPFNAAFANQTADEYIVEFLIGRFHPACIVVGYDHKFGKGRQGDIDYLKKFSQLYHFEVVEIPKQEVHEVAVSSSKIRKALTAGKVEEAKQLLGSPYELAGVVVKGQQIGKTLGFPTANLAIGDPHKLIPADGVYAVMASHKGALHKGMLYIGNRPTLADNKQQSIEVHLFDFEGDIYGEEVRLFFHAGIRGDRQFSDLEELRQQLVRDQVASLEQLKNVATPSPFPVAVVILNYNGKVWLEKFMEPLLRHTKGKASIVVADNCSTDDSLAFLETYFPEVRIIRLTDNFGFAEGYNRAIAEVKEEYVLLLNSDVQVTPGWLAPLINSLQSDSKIAAVQPKILSYGEPEKFEYAGAAGGWIDQLGYPFCRGRIFQELEKDEGQYDTAAEIFWASGAAFLIKTTLFKEIGGFDGSYFAHLEEIDLCWRLKRAGYKIVYEPKSVVMHVGGGTLGYVSPRKTYLNFRNSLITIFKNKGVLELLWLIPLRLIMDGLAGILFLKEGKIAHISAIIRAHFSFYGRFLTILKRRATEKALIQKKCVGKERKTGILQGSIVWNYYVRGKKYFHSLNIRKHG